MAAGNTFGATALSSYGGFWIALGITFTPGFQIMSELQKADNGSTDMFYDSYGLFLMVSQFSHLNHPLLLSLTTPRAGLSSPFCSLHALSNRLRCFSPFSYV